MARTGVFLYGCFKDDYFATVKSRSIYYLTFVLSTYALALIIALQMIIAWADYGHFPTLSFMGWLIIGGINAYHWIILRSFMNFEDQADDSGV